MLKKIFTLILISLMLLPTISYSISNNSVNLKMYVEIGSTRHYYYSNVNNYGSKYYEIDSSSLQFLANITDNYPITVKFTKFNSNGVNNLPYSNITVGITYQNGKTDSLYSYGNRFLFELPVNIQERNTWINNLCDFESGKGLYASPVSPLKCEIQNKTAIVSTAKEAYDAQIASKVLSISTMNINLTTGWINSFHFAYQAENNNSNLIEYYILSNFSLDNSSNTSSVTTNDGFSYNLLSAGFLLLTIRLISIKRRKKRKKIQN